jgi:hypothetical protein
MVARNPSQKSFKRKFSMREMPIYLDGRELQLKPRM